MKRLANYFLFDPKGKKIYQYLYLGLGFLLLIISLIIAIVLLPNITQKRILFGGAITLNQSQQILLLIISLLAGGMNFVGMFYATRKKVAGSLFSLIASPLETSVRFFDGQLILFLNGLSFMILRTITYVSWRKHQTPKRKEIQLLKTDTKSLYLVLGFALFQLLLFLVLFLTNQISNLGKGWQIPYFLVLSALSMITAFIAQGLTMLRYKMSWLWWLVYNCLWLVLDLSSIIIFQNYGLLVFLSLWPLYQINLLLTIYGERNN